MLKDKAIENLAAGEILLTRGFVNAATSRFYYAMYEAAVDRLGVLGIAAGSVQSGAVRWEHAMVANNTWVLRRRRQDRELYTSMMDLRVRADYFDMAVTEMDLTNPLPSVRNFIQELTS